VEVQDAQSGIDACLQALDFNPEELEITEERLFAIRGLARKHQVPVEELGAFCTTLSARLAALDNSTQTLDQLRAALTAAQSGYQTASAELRQARQAAADKLDAAMAAELPPLKLERAVFETQVSPGAEGPAGADQVAFCVATNPGAPSGPLAKIASGGELSRFMLALKMCLSIGRSQATMMFDEIDRGVGGATADAVGRRLSRLASEGQILVVTHSPQVAACGQAHFQVTKEQTADQTRSVVRALDAGERVDEIARMISGTQVTTEAKAAAKALLAGS
ncbi:MAG: DNA repair protein RecN, partial [Paracoccaceae bacterium]